MAVPVHIADLHIALSFIDALKSASLDDENLDVEVLERLHHPLQELVDDIDPDLRLSIDLFLSTSNSSQQSYTSAQEAILRRHPQDEILSYARIKSKIAKITGIVPLMYDMCINSCLTFTGPFSELSECPTCNEARFDSLTELPRQKFHTIPIGPQLQALWRSAESAQNMRHRTQRTNDILEKIRQGNGDLLVYDDVYYG